MNEKDALAFFWEHLPAEVREGRSPPATLASRLSDLVAIARRAWPALDVPSEAFLPYLAARLSGGGEIEDALARLWVADLYIACACVRGAPAALAAFEHGYFSELRLAVVRAGYPPALAEEVQQILRGRLLVGQPPRLAQYAGTGSLRNWLRVVAVREALRLCRGAGEEEPTPAEDLERLVSQGPASPELRYLKQAHGNDFREAFLEAVGALSSRERGLLRYHYLDGLTLEALGRRYRVHRITIARRLARARNLLLAETRTRLQARLGASDSEISSLVRVLRTELGETLRRVLAKEEGRRK